jgi:hypothetical protein
MTPNTPVNREESVMPDVWTAAEPVRERPRTARLGLPVDDELSASLHVLEETLLALIDLVADARTAADTAGRLASLVDPDRSHAIQPLVGQTEVVPLAFRCIRRRDLDGLAAATSTAIGTNAPDDVAETLAEVAAVMCPWRLDDRQADAGAQLRSEITRAIAVIQVDHGDDLDGLARLYTPLPERRHGSVEQGQETIVLTAPEATAYGRVVDRCLAAWRPGDPLARFLYKGL